jgi:magnesium-transporting ATPase (P-type)
MVFKKKKEEVEIDRTKIFPWHAKTKEECFAELKVVSENDASFIKQGLTTEQATQRLQEFGENKLTEKEKVTLLQRIWHQLANVLVGILVFVAAVSAVRAATADVAEDVLTNSIQVGLIIFVIV